jgi:hypothetical protein
MIKKYFTSHKIQIFCEYNVRLKKSHFYFKYKNVISAFFLQSYKSKKWRKTYTPEIKRLEINVQFKL